MSNLSPHDRSTHSFTRPPSTFPASPPDLGSGVWGSPRPREAWWPPGGCHLRQRPPFPVTRTAEPGPFMISTAPVAGRSGRTALGSADIHMTRGSSPSERRLPRARTGGPRGGRWPGSQGRRREPILLADPGLPMTMSSAPQEGVQGRCPPRYYPPHIQPRFDAFCHHHLIGSHHHRSTVTAHWGACLI